MNPYDIICVKLDKVKANGTPYCVIVGYQVDEQFEPHTQFFKSKEDFDQYRNVLFDIFEPAERPHIVFI